MNRRSFLASLFMAPLLKRVKPSLDAETYLNAGRMLDAKSSPCLKIGAVVKLRKPPIRKSVTTPHKLTKSELARIEEYKAIWADEENWPCLPYRPLHADARRAIQAGIERFDAQIRQGFDKFASPTKRS